MRFLLFTSILALSSLLLTAKPDDGPPRPNIVLILADDLGYSDLGCYGSEVRTPNLDRLAENGIRFTQVYNTSKCFPSRACLLTGAYAQQTGMNRQPAVIQNALTLGELLKMGGYRTLWSGKHHGTENPVTRGFDHYYGLRDGACNHFNPGNQRKGEGKPARKRSDRTWCIDEKKFVPYTPEKGFYTTDYFTNYALQWLDEPGIAQQPFFLFLAYTAPHDPLMAWPEDIAKYKGVYDKGYEAIRQQRFEKQRTIGVTEGSQPLSSALHRTWSTLSDQEKTEEARKMEDYAAMIDRMDQNIGRVIRKIKEMGQEDNTLYIFLSDNGASAEVVNLNDYGEIGSMTRWTSLGADWANVANTPLKYYKNYSYEGGIRTPMIASWPAGITSGNRFEDTPLHFIDFFRTFASLSGVEVPEVYNQKKLVSPQGIDFSPLFRGKEVQRNQPLFWQWSKGKAIRHQDWKLVSWDGSWELYNLRQDPSETRNLATTEPQKADSLSFLFDQWQERMNAYK